MAEPKFTLPELTGSMADLGTIIPFILIAVSLSGMKLGPILLMFGLYYVITGLIYRLPVAVEPLKVVGALIVSAGLTQGEIVGAGLFVGVVFLFIGATGLIDYIAKIFPLSIIRGVQLGLALLLLLKGGQYIYGDLLIGIAAVCIFSLSLLWNRDHDNLSFPGALIIFALGIAYGLYVHGIPPVSISLPLELYVPGVSEVLSGIYKAGIAQVPLTLTNAVLATSLLASDLFREKISNRKLCVTIGVTDLIAPLLGGLPMCHGAGGMAAHYRFGARTGGADIMIGAIFVALSFIATSAMLNVIPLGIMGTLLFFAGAELLRSAIKTDVWPVTLGMGAVTLLVDPTIGLAAGILLYVIYLCYRQLRKKPTNPVPDPKI
ncbi:MAG TPA: putative sulfate/molybdate transporter [Methanocella sp.]|uniref:putative sulfate/molybdate transporter n=1 Tax=Methanocella sp. TaxID=2052833 RepID=UPI002C407B27|nr:putative sulfate/molybdate transporter [Methanocella sp.]HTY90453.1 putative sulfate/molybdate transporter [Methanocella sp.]